MLREGKLEIPVSVLAFPFVAIFRIVGGILGVVRSILTGAFLATGVGTVIAALTGGFSRKYSVVDYETAVNDLGHSMGRLKVAERPGWARRLMGSRIRQNEYFARKPEDINERYHYFGEDNQPIRTAKRRKIQCALQAYNVKKHFNA